MSSVTRTYFMLSVTDMARAVTFYREVLGPVIRHESETWSELKLGEATVALHATEQPNPKHTGLAAEVTDLYTAYHSVLTFGGQVLTGPTADALGQLSYEVADTEGNVFTLAGPVPSTPSSPVAVDVPPPAPPPSSPPAGAPGEVREIPEQP
jgi:predicted enzyme related to lactoylglutathione lyase